MIFSHQFIWFIKCIDFIKLILFVRRLPSLVLIVFVLGVSAIRSAYALQSLPMTDAAHTAVIGIVCDNLADMPVCRRNRLYLPLPADLLQTSLLLSLTEGETMPVSGLKISANNPPMLADNTTRPPRQRAQSHSQSGERLEAANVGTIEREGDRLIYTPPNEFNRTSFPQRLQDITRTPRRTILLTVRRQDPNGARVIVAQQPIVLARPPVVMVHGVNTNTRSADWVGRNTLVAIFPRYGMTPVLFDHGALDFNRRDPRAHPALDFAGNGPVERGAQQLAETIIQTLRRVQDQEHLAIRRVDLIGHSYGGVICRWYLHSFRHDPRTADSVSWYVRSLNSGAPDGLYWIDPDWYRRQLEPRPPHATGVSANSPVTSSAVTSSAVNSSAVNSSAVNSSVVDVPVRKCLTVASMWRGVPLCNYANEVHAAPVGGSRLADAPLLFSTVGKLVDGSLSSILPTRVPSLEVMAVNSPWLDALNNYQEKGQRKPCLDNVAYGCVAGDNPFYLESFGISFAPYELLHLAQSPSWFPYPALEHRQDSNDIPTEYYSDSSIDNYTDGLVPLWSAIAAGNENKGEKRNEDEKKSRLEEKKDFGNGDRQVPSRIVHSNHVSLLTDLRAREYVLCALNNSSWLPIGRVLNARWNQTITSRDPYTKSEAQENKIRQQNSPLISDWLAGVRTSFALDRTSKMWSFLPGRMAPAIQDILYSQIALLGRINPLALREIRGVMISGITKKSAEISWKTAAPLDGHVTVREWRCIDFARYEDAEVSCKIEAIGHTVTQAHHFRLSGLQPNTAYHVIVTSETQEEPDAVVSVRSDVLSFSTKH